MSNKNWKKDFKSIQKEAGKKESGFNLSDAASGFMENDFALEAAGKKYDKGAQKGKYKEIDDRVAEGFLGMGSNVGVSELRMAARNSSTFNKNKRPDNNNRNNTEDRQNDRRDNNNNERIDNRIDTRKLNLDVQLTQLQLKFGLTQYGYKVKSIVDRVDSEHDLHDIHKFKLNAQFLLNEYQSNEYRIFGLIKRCEEAIKRNNIENTRSVEEDDELVFEAVNKSVVVECDEYVELTMDDVTDKTVDNAVAITLQNMVLSGIKHLKAFCKESSNEIKEIESLLPPTIRESLSIKTWLDILARVGAIFKNAKSKFGLDFYAICGGIFQHGNLDILLGGFKSFYSEFKNLRPDSLAFAKGYLSAILTGASVSATDGQVTSINKDGYGSGSFRNTIIEDLCYNIDQVTV